jgi:serine/threonine protein kinase
VAVKVIRINGPTDLTNLTRTIKRLRQEIKVWARLQHEHILPLLGLVRDFGSVPGLVLPWMHNGNLLSFLQRNSALTRYERFRLVSILRSDYPCKNEFICV